MSANITSKRKVEVYCEYNLTLFPDSFSFRGIGGLRIFDIFIDFSDIGIFFFDLISLNLIILIKVILRLADKEDITNLKNARDNERVI